VVCPHLETPLLQLGHKRLQRLLPKVLRPLLLLRRAVPTDNVERFFMILAVIGLTGFAATIIWVMLTGA
jgi:hypothetical protein